MPRADGDARPGLPRSALMRLALLYTALFTLASAALFALIYGWTVADSLARLDRAVRDDLTTQVELFRRANTTGLVQAIDAFDRRGSADRLYLLVDAEAGRLAGTVPRWPDGLAAGGGASDIRAAPAGVERTFRAIAADLGGGLRLAVGHLSADHDLLRQRLWNAMLAALGLSAAFGLIGAVIAVRPILRRIDAVNRTIRQVETGDFSARVPTATLKVDEFGLLAGNVNRMLDRINALVRGVSEVSDRVAHELRTPLARLRATISAARTEAPAGLSARLDGAVGEVDTIIAVFAALLDIASAEAAAGNPADLEPVDLAAVIDDVLSLYDAVAEERGLDLQVTTERPLPILADRMLVTRMLANIVDNALKFSEPGTTVTIAGSSRGAHALLAVGDRGPGLSQGFSDRALDRFARAPEAAAVPGHGLGLSLVKAIALRHGMRLRLENTSPGLRVTVEARRLDDAESHAADPSRGSR